MTVSSLDIVRKVLVSQNAYVDKTTEKHKFSSQNDNELCYTEKNPPKRFGYEK